jgi:hypothetical protein
MIDVSQVEPPSSGQDSEKTLVPTLPSFPLPALPDAPSKSVLALQGLDQALLDAEFVNPTTTSPVSKEEEDPFTGLGLKTRQRLKELGIEEFFAGMSFPVCLTNIPSNRPFENAQCKRGFCHFSFLWIFRKGHCIFHTILLGTYVFLLRQEAEKL